MKKKYFSLYNIVFQKMSVAIVRMMLITIMLFASSIFNNHFAQVIITAPALFDTATCKFPTPYFTLDDIVITESLANDFSTTGGGTKTLILVAPANFSFKSGNPPVGSSVVGLSADITILSLTSVTSTKITLTFKVVGTAVLDAVTISGIQVRGNISPSGPSNLQRGVGAAGGTAVINGDIDNTVHATFTSIARDPTTIVQPTDQTICEGAIGNFNAFAIGTPTYQWQEDQGGGFVNLANGGVYSNVTTSSLTIIGVPVTMNSYQYRCIITGADDVCNTDTTLLTVNAPPLITADPTDTTVCQANNASFTVVATGSSLTYNWERSTNGGANFFPFAIVPPYSVLANSLIITAAPFSFNNYQYRCVVGGDCGPDINSIPGILTVNPKPTVLTVNDSACSPGTVDLTLPQVTVGSTGGLTFNYFTDAGATTYIADSTAAGAGVYYIMGTTGFGCTDTTSVAVAINPKPTVVTTNPTAVCAPDTIDITLPAVTLGSSGGLAFSYYTDSAATIVYGTPTTADSGTYYIVGTTVFGCSDTTAVIVTINPKPTVVTNNPAAICSPATVDLTLPAITAGSTPGLAFTYYTDSAATLTYATPATAVAGDYFIVGTTLAGCSDTTKVTVTVSAQPSLLTTPPAAVCSPLTVDLTLPAYTAGSTPGLTLNYYTDAGATIHIADSSAVAANGTYYITGLLIASGCSDTTAIVVTIDSKPALLITNPPAVCVPATVDLTLPANTVGSTGGLTFTYFTDAGATTHIADSSAVAASGTYYIVGLQPATGCTDTAAITVTINVKPDVFTTNPADICFPETIDLTLPAVTVGSTGGLTYNYYTDAGATIHTTDSSAVATSGTYYIVGVIGGGCSDTTAVSITINPKPDVLTTNPPDICSPGTVDLTLPAVTAGSTLGLTYNYFIDAGATTHIADSSAVAISGTYYIVGVEPVTGCSDTTAVTVTINPKPDVFTTAPTAVCEPFTIDITLPAVTAGSTPGLTYNYFIDAGATTHIADSSAVAVNGIYYIVGLLPATGCSDTTAVTVTINAKPVLVINDPGICSPSTMDLTSPAVTLGSPGGLTFNYFTDAAATIHVADSSVVNAGTYYIVGTAVGGCSDTAAVTVTLNPKPDVFTSAPSAVCSPATVDLTLPAVTAGSTAGLTFNYFTDAGATTYIADSSAVTTSGTYYILGMIVATGCSDTTAVTVTVNPKPTVITTDPAPVCSATIDLTLPAVTSGSTPGLTFNYFTDAGATTHTADSSAIAVSATYYIVGVLAATGCSDTTAVTASVNASAIGGSVVSDALVCSGANGDTLTLTGYSGTIVKWQYSVNAGANWIDIINTTDKQFYSNITITTWYRAQVSAFCSSALSAEARITVDSTPLPIGGTVSANNTVCSGSNNDTLTLTGHTGNIVRWEQSIDGGNTWIYISNTTTSHIYNNLTTTTIYHAVVQNSICNFAISSNDTITVNPASNAGLVSGAVPVCADVNAGTLTLTGYTGIIQNWEVSVDSGLTWSNIVNTTASQFYSNLPDTTLYRAIVKSGVCSADTSAATPVIVYPKPIAQYTADTVCLGAVTTFVNSSSIESGFIQLYKWEFGDNNSSLSINPSHIYSSAGSNPVSLITVSNFGCIDTATVAVLVNPLPDALIIAAGPLSFCCGGSLSISGNAGLDYLWSTSETTQSIVVNDCQASGVYSLTVTDPSTLCTNSSSVSIDIFPLPVAFAGNDTSISLGSSYILNGQGGTTYSWLPATGLNNPDIATPLAAPLETTTFVLTISDVNGCSGTDSLTIIVTEDFTIEITNLLTTNGDGYNDKWFVKNIENYPNTEAIVVNREGQQVFYSTSYDNSWEGLNKDGKPLPDGTYYYFLKFKNSNKIYKGPLTILNEK